MKLNIGSNIKTPSIFELVIELKDKDGNPTGIKKSYQTNDASKLSDFWIRNNGIDKKKKRKKSDTVSSKDDINSAIKEIDNYTNKIRKEKDLND